MILWIDACVRKESRTKELAETLLGYLDDEVKALHLNNETLEPLTRESLIYRDKCIASNDVENNSLHYAREFARADTIVIAAPYWDLSFPAIFRTYIERIMVSGITFQYGSDGTVKGLCNARRILYVSTAGGMVIGAHMGFEYIKQLAEHFWKIPECSLFVAEGLDFIGADVDSIMQKTHLEIKNAICI